MGFSVRRTGVRPNFSDMTDEEVVMYSQSTEDEGAVSHIIHKYRNLIRSKARTYYLVGADRDDIVQEGLIGLYKAMRDYEPTHNASFCAFAELCIKRQVITAIKAATRNKHMPLNSYVSLQKPVREDSQDRMLIDIFDEGHVMSPEEIFIGWEEYEELEEFLSQHLTTLEWEVLVAYLEGKTYQEIMAKLSRDFKSIDNALQRVKRKVEKYVVQRRENGRKEG